MFVLSFDIRYFQKVMDEEIFQCVRNMGRYVICYYTSINKFFLSKYLSTCIMKYDVCVCVLNSEKSFFLVDFWIGWHLHGYMPETIIIPFDVTYYIIFSLLKREFEICGTFVGITVGVSVLCTNLLCGFL